VTKEEQFRALPSVDELARAVASELPHALVVDECRATLAILREQIQRGETVAGAEQLLRERLQFWARPSLRKVINATGVILHTNLGRAPLAALAGAEGYSNLEYSLKAGRRGKRDEHTERLLGWAVHARSIVVNNGAAAVYLALNELAAGGEVIVSRGELIEIGDGFRIPDIMARSGARLVEVGTTNRTRIEDYARAITPQTRLLMRVHPSNFRMSGFTGRPALGELAMLGREHNIPVYEDLGSGCVVDLSQYGIDEPTVQASLDAGADLVSFSGDKLLGGPQAGILAGRRSELVERLRRNPMYRALRVDKLVIGALETTLRLILTGREDEVPVLRMIRMSRERLLERARRFLEAGCEVVEGHSLVGGGSTPEQRIASPLVAVPGDEVELERRLRMGEPPVVTRIEDGRLLIDLRTVDEGDDEALLAALQAAASSR
jgi:L-seryl-tRNA(Ser) seleniumtransferase